MAKEFKSYREESKKKYGQELEDNKNLCIDQLKFGAIQRIADACEVMAHNHQQLIDDRDRYEKWYKEERAEVARLRHKVSALKGYITKLKKVKH